jgi:hypothetical protein
MSGRTKGGNGVGRVMEREGLIYGSRHGKGAFLLVYISTLLFADGAGGVRFRMTGSGGFGLAAYSRAGYEGMMAGNEEALIMYDIRGRKEMGCMVLMRWL